jgi:insulin-like growth factor-binding protein complex acid labile subunit
LLNLTTRFTEFLINIEELYIDNNRIKTLNSLNLSNFKKLKTLVLKSNELSSSNVFLFKTLSTTSKKDIDISSNFLTKLTNLDFGDTFQSVIKLNLFDNKIESIENETFRYLRELIYLNLNQNFLIELKNKTFATMKTLKELCLSKNSLSFFNKETFEGLKNLINLTINDNYLTHLNDYVFYDLVSIKFLYLINNQIEFISTKTFSCSYFGNSKVKIFLLRLNRIKSLKFLRSCLGFLEKIDLSDNLIESVEISDFEFLESLLTLYLSNNKIIFIEKYAYKTYIWLIFHQQFQLKSI